MMNWTIRQRILASFAVILTLMVAMGGIAYTRLTLIEQKTAEIERESLPGLYVSAQLTRAWVENYSLTQGHILHEDVAAMRKLESQLAANRAKQESLVKDYEKTIFDAKNGELFDAFKKPRAEYERIQQEVLKLSADNRNKEASALLINSLNPKFDNISASLQVLEDYDRDSADNAALEILR